MIKKTCILVRVSVIQEILEIGLTILPSLRTILYGPKVLSDFFQIVWKTLTGSPSVVQIFLKRYLKVYTCFRYISGKDLVVLGKIAVRQ